MIKRENSKEKRKELQDLIKIIMIITLVTMRIGIMKGHEEAAEVEAEEDMIEVEEEVVEDMEEEVLMKIIIIGEISTTQTMKKKIMDGEALIIERGVEVMKKKKMLKMNGSSSVISFLFLSFINL